MLDHDTALDIDALERVLSRIPGAMPLPWALGLLTASLSAPALPHSNAGIQKLLSAAELESPDQVVELMQVLMAVHNELAERLEAGRPAGPPRTDDAFVMAWCSSYVDAFTSDREGLLGDADLACLLPFAAIAGEAGVRDEDGEATPADAAALAEAVASWQGQLDELVRDVHEHFRAARRRNVPGGRSRREFASRASSGGETYRRTAPKIGRNEPCPCGSGKKYKRCCGAAEP